MHTQSHPRPARDYKKGVVISMTYLCMKFYTPNGIGVVRSNKKSTRKCYLEAINKNNQDDVRINTISQQVKNGEKKERPIPAYEVEEIVLDQSLLDKKIRIGIGLPARLLEEVIHILTSFKIIFEWGLEDMLGVDRSVICHRISVIP